MSYSKVIAIDGPSGSGKSSLAKLLSQRLNILYVNTGSMYRALGLRAEELGVDLDKGKEVENFLAKIQISYASSLGVLISIDGKDYTPLLHSPKASILACAIAQISQVRHFLVQYQRFLAEGRVCVMEGRDIGTVVFPNAFMKFFVTASLENRVQRRWEQLKSQGKNISRQKVREEEEERDRADTQRDHSPLQLAKDGVLVDTDSLSLEEALEVLIQKTQQRVEELGITL